ESCPTNIMSCTPESSKLSTCCSPKYGLVAFAVQWLPTMGPAKNWTIHGHWPDKCDGTFAPGDGCDNTRKYTGITGILAKRDPALLDRMNTLWPSSKGDNEWFFQHEFHKHGTCVSTMHPDCYADYQKHDDMVEYFTTALDMAQQYNPYDAFADAGIVPGGTYNRDDMIKAIAKKWNGMAAKLFCKRGQIEEIQMFFKVKGRNEHLPTSTLGK
ncbi:ribonuclease T2, partial [Ramicandelaber brevisporus]